MTGALVLAGGALVLVVLTAATARRPAEALPDRAGYFERWKVQHNAPDVEPGQMVFVSQTLTIAYWFSRPLARVGCQPDVLTLWGAWLAGAVLVTAAPGGRWPIAAAAIVIVSALADAVDGCVAALTDRATRFGFVLDSVVDRASDGAYVLALLALDGSPVAAACAGAGIFSLEYTRARAGNAGLGEVGVVTVGERPTRVVVAVVSLLAAGVYPERHDLFADLGLWATLAVCGVGELQLGWHLWRRLR